MVSTIISIILCVISILISLYVLKIVCDIFVAIEIDSKYKILSIVVATFIMIISRICWASR